MSAEVTRARWGDGLGDLSDLAALGADGDEPAETEEGAVPGEVDASRVSAGIFPGKLAVRRGFFAMPTDDVRVFATQQMITAGAGLAVGLLIGALLAGVIDLRGLIGGRGS